MKKWIVLLLSLLLLLPAAAQGETGARAVEFEDFIIHVGENDLLQMGEAGAASLFQLFPDYDEAAQGHPNLSASLAPAAISVLTEEEAAFFAENVMQAGMQSLTGEGITVAGQQLLRGDLDAETGAVTVLFTLVVDASALGVEQTMQVYMGCRYYPVGDERSLSFTVGCTTPEEAEMLFAYLDQNLVIKK
ncbi:MAG: hypothetical protein E7320_06620 [Clostridiales bacterium]|nr:hypothetical protein [Clostridiales bacterium]